MLHAGQYGLKPNIQPPQRRLGAARSMKSPRGWKRSFEEPIPLPRGRQLVTLEDAGQVHHQTEMGARGRGEAIPNRAKAPWASRGPLVKCALAHNRLRFSVA